MWLMLIGIFIDNVESVCPQRWEYMHAPEPGSREVKLTEVLKNPKDWV